MSIRSESQRRFARSKQSERDLGKWLIEFDGPDPRFKNIASSTGRVGHISSLQYDVVSKTYCAENKQVRLPIKMLKWWQQITMIAADNDKEALLRIEPTNIDTAPNPRLRKKPESLHIISESRHRDLLQAEQERDFLQIRVAELEQWREDNLRIE